MKICFLITGLGLGGAERHLLKLLPKLKYNKFVISILNQNYYGKEIEKRGIKVYYLGLNKFNLHNIILKFYKILNYEKPDLIDTYLIHANIFGRIFGKMFRIKRIISSMRSDYSKFRILKFIDKITQNLVDIYILNSKSLLTYVFKNKIPLTKIKYLPNGIDIDEINKAIDTKFNLREDLGLSKDSYIIIFVGRLIKDKNLIILIKAMKLIENKNIVLLIVGEGSKKQSLFKYTKKLNLNERILFLGQRKEVFNLINGSDLFVLPSTREGMSNALLEAMALKKVCIVSDIPQNRILIKEGINGLIFDPKNENELAAKILSVYSNISTQRFGLKSFELIQKCYKIDKIVDKYENILNKLLERN